MTPSSALFRRFRAALDVAVVGDARSIPLAERSDFLALAKGSTAERAAATARLLLGVQRRAVGLSTTLREAAASGPELADLWRQNELRRRISVEQAGAMVAGRPLTKQERDGPWAVASIEGYQLLTGVAGWSGAEYRDWMADTVLRLLERSPASPTRRGRSPK